MDFEDLSPQVLSSIVQDLTFEQLNQLCSLNLELEEKICQNEEFWQQKYLQAFGVPKTSPLIWREAYRQRLTNQVLAFGSNYFGQLGLGDKQNRLIPERIPSELRPNEKIIAISAGKTNHNLILTEDGQIYAFGSNIYGQLGLGDQQERLRPERISFGLKPKEKIIAISAGRNHSLILAEDGQVFAFGDNLQGQLGSGDQEGRLVPEQISLGLKPKEKIILISAGDYHSLILTENGQVYTFGLNRFGQLGLGDQETRFSPERIPFGLKSKEKITSISAGSDHSLILTENGQVYAFGWNFYGQLGLGDGQDRLRPERISFGLKSEEKITAISAGGHHSLILTENGEVYAFGRNNGGQLGFGDQKNRWIPEKISLPQRIISISAGDEHSLILTEKGSVYAFGWNFYGQLGLGDPENRLGPERISFGLKPEEKIISISAGGVHSLILTGEDALFSSISTLIQNNWVKNYELKYSTSNRTAVFEFIDIQDRSYQIEVFYDPETKEIFELSQ